MGLTITEKILLNHSDKKEIVPGDFIYAKLDMCLGNDITAPIAIEEFRKSGATKVFDSRRIALVCDHFTPAKDIRSANQAKFVKNFAREHKIENFFDAGVGVEHALLPELGLVKPGDLVIGADSHTCTYGALGAFATGVGSTDLAAAFITGRCWFKVPESIKFICTGKLKKWVTGKDIILYVISKIGVDGALYKAMEFAGEAISSLDMDERFSLCNMAIEAGGKSGIIAPDEKTWEYVAKIQKIKHKVQDLRSDKDAKYSQIEEYDFSKVEPVVACPDLPSNGRPVSKLKNVAIDQVVIGSCTNGRISDLRIASKVLKGKKVKHGVRLIVLPATKTVYLQAIKEGLAKIFIDAGGSFCVPSCGPCIGGHLGVLAAGEVAISTTNRNFVGRMGDLKSRVYLSSPAVAAASAIKGKITHPDEVA